MGEQSLQNLYKKKKLYTRLQSGLLNLKQLHKKITDRYCWAKQARPSQQEPQGEWRVWLILAGRGFGKTRTGAETVRAWVEQKKARRICLLADSLDDGRKVMIEGESGLLRICPPGNRPTFLPSQQ